jgi:hypothetical protein
MGFVLLVQTLTFAVLSQTTGVVICCEIETWSASHRPYFKKSEKLKNETDIPTS